MFLTSEHAVRNILLMLPHATQFLLEINGRRELCYLLELVKAHNNLLPLLLGYFLWQREYLVLCIIAFIPFKGQAKVIEGI